jgi:iron complex transport system substrate-binding protein
MKVCSFLPAATTMIYDMGLQEFLCGVTFECPSERPKVVRSILENNNFSSREIDTIVSQTKAQGKGLYYIDEELLSSLSPDIIFTQDVCDVCQIDTAYVQRAIHKLKKQPLIVPLIPRNLKDVFDNAVTIARILEKEENAYGLLAKLEKRTDKIIDTLRKNKAGLKRIMLMEWLDPIYNCGHWIPDMIAQAGGVDMLSNPSGYSITIPWEKIIQYDPQVLVVASCGFKPERTLKEMDKLTQLTNWDGLAAVKNKAVYIVDSDLFTCPSTRLVEGIELLAALFHPQLFSLPESLFKKVIRFENSFSSSSIQ